MLYPPQTPNALARVTPVYEKLPGWQEDISLLRNVGAAAENTRRYIERVEELMGVRAGIHLRRSRSQPDDSALAYSMADSKRTGRTASRASSSSADEERTAQQGRSCRVLFFCSFFRAVAGSGHICPPLQIRLLSCCIWKGESWGERVGLALWWAALINCEHVDVSGSGAVPCLSCPACLRIGAGMYPDLVVLDGREGSIKIDSDSGTASSSGRASPFWTQTGGRHA